MNGAVPIAQPRGRLWNRSRRHSSSPNDSHRRRSAGVSKDSLQQALCAGEVVATAGQDGADEDMLGWGRDALGRTSSLQVSFKTDTHRADFVSLGYGYDRMIEFKSRPGSRFGEHTYSMMVFDAMMFTFAPELPGESVNCVASRHCLVRAGDLGGDGKEAVFGARDLHFYVHFAAPGAAQPAASSPDYFYVFPQPVGFTPPPVDAGSP